MPGAAGNADVTKQKNVLDVRSEGEYQRGHAPGSVNIPAEELPARMHELPPKGETLLVYHGNREQCARVVGLLRERGYEAMGVEMAAGELTETGAGSAQLWRVSPLLEEALAVARAGMKVVDLGCGSGREAVWLAKRGFAVCGVDLLPDALAKGMELARRSGVEVEFLQRDLVKHPEQWPGEQCGMVCVFRFWCRALLERVREKAAAGTLVVVEAFTQREQKRQGKGRRVANLVRDGELAELFKGWEILINRDGVQREGRWLSQLVARKR